MPDATGVAEVPLHLAPARDLVPPLRNGLCVLLHTHPGLERRVHTFLEVEVEVPRFDVLEEVRHVHVGAAAEVRTRPELGVPERLEVCDAARAERVLLRRGEAEEELRAVGDQLGASNPRCGRHPLGQPAADEAVADARDLEDAQVLEQRLRAVVHVRGDVATEQDGDVVLLQDRLFGIAREPDRVEQDALPPLGRCPAVDRDVDRRLVRDDAVEIGQAPGDRDAEAGGTRRVEALLERDERVLELSLRCPRVAGRDPCSHEPVMERRHDDLHPLVLDDAELERVLVGRTHPADALPLRRVTAEPVGELVDARTGERGRRGARQRFASCQLHAETRTRPRRIRSRYTRTFV